MTVTVQVGSFNHPEQVVTVDESATVQDAFTRAGISVNSNESIRMMNTNRAVGLTDPVVGNEVYVITGNHVSG